MNAVVAEVNRMPPIYRIMGGVKGVDAVVQELAAHPDLWDRNRFRTEGGAYNPHHGVSDIIVRFNDWKHWKANRAQFNAQHESVWWEAIDFLPSIKPLVFDLARFVEAEQIGMVLLTRVAPHCSVAWHLDRGWHASYYTKYLISLKADSSQRFAYATGQGHNVLNDTVEDFSIRTETGDLCLFRNDIPHAVFNEGDEERISLIVCLRTRQPTCYDCHYSGGSV